MDDGFLGVGIFIAWRSEISALPKITH